MTSVQIASLNMEKKEIFDIVTQDDVIIGTASREECHSSPKLIHHTVQFTYVDQISGKILLTQRAFIKKHDGGKFCFLGEHILSGETYPQALVRGSQEEMQYTPKKWEEMSSHIFKYAEQTEFVRFFVVDWDGTELKFDANEIEQILWVSLEDLRSDRYDISEMTRHWIDNIDWTKALEGSYE